MRTENLNRSIRVNFPLGGEVRFMRELGGGKSAEPKPFGVQDYGCRPPTLTRRYAEQPMHVVGLRDSEVLPIFKSINGAKIGPPVVELIAVDVIDFGVGPTIGDVEISKSVGKILMAVDAYLRVPAGGHSFPGLFAYANVRTSRAFLRPSENPGSGVVKKQFAQAGYSKIWLSHAVSPVKKWFGQRPARVISTGGLRYFITRAYSCATGITKCLHEAALAAAAVCIPANHRRIFNPSGALTPFNAL